MTSRIWSVAALLLFLVASAFAQPPAGYLDVFIVHIKPEKRFAFEAINKKMVEIERKNKGDYWTAAETLYGEQNTFYFISQRSNYAAAGDAANTFFAALVKSIGPAGVGKLFQEYNDCMVSARGEMRVRRLDLSRNAPSDAAARARLLGAAQFSRTFIVRVRPGHSLEYETLLREAQTKRVEAGDRTTMTVYQSDSGGSSTTYYLSELGSSMGSFDGNGLRERLGEGFFQHYQAVMREAVLGSETIINHYLPELSNPPEAVVAAGPEFWKPKPPALPPSKKQQ